MRRRSLVLLSFPALFALAACAAGAAGAGEPTAQPSGAGLLSFDAEAPPGAKTWDRPTWRVGETFVVRRGGRVQGEFRVVAVDGVYVLDTGGGPLLHRDLDLGNLGEWAPDGKPLRELAPVDARFHWPLWVGKKWSCEFVDRGRGSKPVAMQASYLVEEVDKVTVPAGTFEALRIVRTVRLVGAEQVLTKTQISWYAPEAGTEVRQLAGDTFLELVARTVP